MSNFKIFSLLFLMLIAFWGWVIFIVKGGV